MEGEREQICGGAEDLEQGGKRESRNSRAGSCIREESQGGRERAYCRQMCIV